MAVGHLLFREWMIWLRNPGRPLWWPGYLAWRWCNVCWAGHRIRRGSRECDRFWSAEAIFVFNRELRKWANQPAPPRRDKTGKLYD